MKGFDPNMFTLFVTHQACKGLRSCTFAVQVLCQDLINLISILIVPKSGLTGKCQVTGSTLASAHVNLLVLKALCSNLYFSIVDSSGAASGDYLRNLSRASRKQHF